MHLKIIYANIQHQNLILMIYFRLLKDYAGYMEVCVYKVMIFKLTDKTKKFILRMILMNIHKKYNH